MKSVGEKPRPIRATHIILIVEDDPFTAQLLTSRLQSKNYSSHCVTTIKEAQKWLATNTPMLVLLDMKLPDDNGIKLCKHMRLRNILVDVPIIILSGDDSKETITQALKNGADDYLKKPFVEEELFARISIHLERATQKSTLKHVLDHFDIAILVINKVHLIRYANSYAKKVFNIPDKAENYISCLKINPSDTEKILHQLELAPSQRFKAPISLSTPQHTLSFELIVKNNPEDINEYLCYLYNTTEVNQLRGKIARSSKTIVIGRSAAIQNILDQVGRISRVDWHVLILGETGTGKELVAREIHQQSDRADQPFITVNCVALSDSLVENQFFGHVKGSYTSAHQDSLGFFEAANNGTLFLDEIGDMPMHLQGSLLRVLQEGNIIRIGETRARQINVRVVAATHCDLETLIENKKFRADLYYRLNIATINMPSLRERADDIPLLIQFFLNQLKKDIHNPNLQIDNKLETIMINYPWPGNIRELKHSIQSLALNALSNSLSAQDWGKLNKGQKISLKQPKNQNKSCKKNEILTALQQTDGNRTAAAKLLGISRATFYRKLQNLQHN